MPQTNKSNCKYASLKKEKKQKLKQTDRHMGLRAAQQFAAFKLYLIFSQRMLACT